MKCKVCGEMAQVKLPSHHTGFCSEHFFRYFRGQIERAVRRHKMFVPGDRILIALSGGKDSLSLAAELAAMGCDVTGLHVYLGIGSSSDSALELVRGFCTQRNIPLMVADMPAEGLAIPDVKACVRRPVCSVCGKIKRQRFNRAALEGGFNVLATGHNLDDEVARLFANTLRWDASYLSDQGPVLPAENGFACKVKPLYRLCEFETAAYAFLSGITYGFEPCPYSKGASFTGHKALIEDLEETSPGSKISFYDGFLKRGREAFAALEKRDGAELSPCTRCGYPTSQEVCGVCRIRVQVEEARSKGWI